jgi:uroporphyrinogen-III decarboxylase
LRGATKFVIDIKKRPEFVAELLDYCADQTIRIGKALLDRGAIGISLADATGSPSMCSSQQYTELFLPAYKKIQKALAHLTPPGVRWHSQSGIDELTEIERFVRESCEAGNTVFHVATPWSLKLDIRGILEILKEYGACLWFGIAPAAFSQLTPAEMDSLVKEYIEKYAKGYEGQFLMGPNMLNDTSKPELVKAWMNAMRTYGKVE